jgi:acetoin utilization deacetylase AcuC-like enzyme
MTLLVYSHPVCRRHENAADVFAGHPERPERLDAVNAGIERLSPDRYRRIEAPAAERTDFELAHDARYVKAIFEQAPEQGFLRLDGDTSMNPYTLAASRRAVGAAMAAVDAVLQGPERRAFCAIRPPGHHAAACRPAGFCLFNNVVIAAYHAVRDHGLDRVAIVDFDVHHGDGSEQIVAGSAPILFCSSFQHPFYPYSGIPPLADNCLPAPLANLSDGAAYRQAIDKAGWFDRLAAFRPQLLLFSAGFDAHENDPLGGLLLDAGDFAWITREAIAAAGTDVPAVSLLEGGYDLAALEDSTRAHLEALDGG